MYITPVPSNCSVGRAPAGATKQECEALLEYYDAVIVSDLAMITYVDRIPELTAGAIPNWMTDQLGAELRDFPTLTCGQAASPSDLGPETGPDRNCRTRQLCRRPLDLVPRFGRRQQP